MKVHARSWTRPAAGLTAVVIFGLIAFILIRFQPPHVENRVEAASALVMMEFADLPGWKRSDPRAALRAFANSCAVLIAKTPGASLGGAGYAGTAADWRQACVTAPPGSPDTAAARRFFESRFQPLEAIPKPSAPALFTGYYEPELSASRTRHGAYRAPIYSPPDNLVSVDLGAFRPEWEGRHLFGCLADRRLLPCPTRAEIDAHGLSNAPVLFYADDPVAVFFLHIQGSGRIRLDDGNRVRASYAGQNGRPFKPAGRALVDRGWLDRADVSMQSIRGWLKAHASLARGVMETDPSYVFFKEEPLNDPAKGAIGSEGVPLTPGASLAVDVRVHPLGVPVYVAASRPDADPSRPDREFRQLLIAQDTGGAIRGAARGDVYWGWGSAAEFIAGRMKATGRFFVLVPKAVAARIRGRMPLPVS